jgi:hypothetical protein
MPNPNRTSKPDIEKSEQELVNKSFDREFDVLAVEALVYNPETGALDRMTQPGATVTTAYETVFDDTTEAGSVYLGKAAPGTAYSAASWQIKKFDGTTKATTYADDVITFTKTWNSRTGYTY